MILTDAELSRDSGIILHLLRYIFGLDNLHLLRDLRLQHQSLIKCDIPAEKKLPIRWIIDLEPFDSLLETDEHALLFSWV